jgi:hypothetical protein
MLIFKKSFTFNFVLAGLISFCFFTQSTFAFSGKRKKNIILINIINFYYLQIECPNSGLADPVLSGVNDCLSWFAYGQSIGQNIQNWCSNSSIATKCCLTCNSN